MTLGQEYLLMVFSACCGALQVAAAYGHLQGLLLFRDRRLSTLIGAALIAGSLAWFFRDGGRNIPDTQGGIAGASQFGLFVLGGFLALLFTFLVTSFANYRKGTPANTMDGLSSLQETTFVQALLSNVSTLWKLYRELTRKYSSG